MLCVRVVNSNQSVINSFHIIFALNRHPETVDRLNRFVGDHGPVHWRNAEKCQECQDVRSVFSNGHEWPYYRGLWYLFRERNGLPRITEHDPFYGHPIEEAMEMFREMSKGYSWTICPWGREQSMEMIAFVTDDERCCDELISCLGGSFSRMSESGLFLDEIGGSSVPVLLAAYKNVESLNREVHGILFNDSATAERIWAMADCEESQPYLLHFRQIGPNADPRSVPSGNFETVETYSDEGDIVRVLLRIHDHGTLAAFLGNWGTAIILAGNANLQSLRTVFQSPEFQIHTASYFLTKIISEARWIYLPEQGNSTTELYKTFSSSDPKMVTSFLNAKCNDTIRVFSFF